MNILHKANGKENVYGFEFIYETKNCFVDIIMETTAAYPPHGVIEPTNIIKHLNVDYKSNEYKMTYEHERFEILCECYDVVHVGELSLSVGQKLDF